MIIIGLDLSTHTGYAVLKDGVLIDYGLISVKVKEWNSHIGSYKDYPDVYPWNFITAATEIADQIYAACISYSPDYVVIEETNQSRQRFSQKILEFIHLKVIERFKGLPIKYIPQHNWRREVNAYATEEEKKLIKKSKKSGIKITKKTSKHYSVRSANEAFNLQLKLKDNNQADAICVALAWWNIQNRDVGILKN